MVEAFKRSNQLEIPYRIVGRRSGDVPEYWADPRLAEQELGWKAIRTLDQMCQDTWRFEQKTS
jgi:UDP-glucose 4-epimerase